VSQDSTGAGGVQESGCTSGVRCWGTQVVRALQMSVADSAKHSHIGADVGV